MKAKEFYGFTFVHAGDFFISKVKSKRKYRWGDSSGTYDYISTCINFSSEDLDEQTELAYIVTVDEKVVYVGEFSKSLRDRWLKVDNYIWHNKDQLIFTALTLEKSVSLWLVNEPWVVTTSGVKINISKAIEHHILKNNSLPWNQRNNSA